MLLQPFPTCIKHYYCHRNTHTRILIGGAFLSPFLMLNYRRINAPRGPGRTSYRHVSK